MRRSAFLLGLGGGVLGAVLLAAAAHSTRAQGPAEVAAATPAAAVALAVAAGGQEYAGPCEQTRSPEDIGKTCSRLVEERDGAHAYLLGRTFSEYSTWLFIEDTGAGWVVRGQTPLDFHDMTSTVPWP